MSDEHREQLQAILDDTVQEWTQVLCPVIVSHHALLMQVVSAARGKSPEAVAALLAACEWDIKALVKQGWLDGLLYDDELAAKLQRAHGGMHQIELLLCVRDSNTGRRRPGLVPATRYALQPCLAPGRGLGSRRSIVVIRASGMITGTRGGGIPLMQTLDVGTCFIATGSVNTTSHPCSQAGVPSAGGQTRSNGQRRGAARRLPRRRRPGFGCHVAGGAPGA